MEKVAFIGGYDKIDFILYIAKILTLAGKRVLISDTTVLKKSRYIVPNINPEFSYITEFEKIDIAIGFYSLEDVMEYLGKSKEEQMEYDYMLLDIDSQGAIENFGITTETKNYFVTAFDSYSIKKGLEVLARLDEPIPLTKVYFSKQVLNSDDEYLEYLALGYKINWNELKIYFPLEQGDLTATIENQKVSKIKFGNLSSQYKDSLSFIIEDITNSINASRVKKLMRNAD